MFLRGRTMFGPCLGDANTHAPHMCQFPYKIKSKYSQQKKQKCTLHPVSEHIRFTPAYPVSATPTAFALRIGQFPLFQRACRQCVHESARLFRVICSHAWYG